MNNKEYNKGYYLKHKEEIKAKSRDYYRTNHDNIRQRQDNYYKKNEDKLRANAKERLRRIKVDVLSYYSHGSKPKCNQCGVGDIAVLTIDHINNNGNEHRRKIGVCSGSGFYYWLKRNNYPSGFQVLCFNHNIKKRVSQLNG